MMPSAAQLELASGRTRAFRQKTATMLAVVFCIAAYSSGVRNPLGQMGYEAQSLGVIPSGSKKAEQNMKGEPRAVLRQFDQKLFSTRDFSVLARPALAQIGDSGRRRRSGHHDMFCP